MQAAKGRIIPHQGTIVNGMPPNVAVDARYPNAATILTALLQQTPAWPQELQAFGGTARHALPSAAYTNPSLGKLKHHLQQQYTQVCSALGTPPAPHITARLTLPDSQTVTPAASTAMNISKGIIHSSMYCTPSWQLLPTQGGCSTSTSSSSSSRPAWQHLLSNRAVPDSRGLVLYGSSSSSQAGSLSNAAVHQTGHTGFAALHGFEHSRMPKVSIDLDTDGTATRGPLQQQTLQQHERLLHEFAFGIKAPR
eukprot:jgi/Chrzof1/1385/Cz10g05200.t1